MTAAIALTFFGATQANAATSITPSKNAWIGIYQGALPCADCSDVSYTVHLFSNNTFQEAKVYHGTRDGLDQPQITKGDFTWHNTKIRLSNGDQYQVSANTITMLDSTGKLVSGPMGAMYVFKKTTQTITH